MTAIFSRSWGEGLTPPTRILYAFPNFLIQYIAFSAGTGLGVAAITGIAIAAALVVFLLGVLIFICIVQIIKKRRAGKPTKPAYVQRSSHQLISCSFFH